MKTTRFLIMLALLLGAGHIQNAHALTWIHTLDFPNPTAITDTSSGNNIDFTYSHLLTGLDPNQITITSASLRLSHFGNANTGPTSEIWRAFSENGYLIGQLSRSDAQVFEDTWQLSPDILNELLSKNPLALTVGLSEQTSFNGERFELRRSVLTLQYDQVLATPEISSLGMVLGSLIPLGLGWFRRKINKSL